MFVRTRPKADAARGELPGAVLSSTADFLIPAEKAVRGSSAGGLSDLIIKSEQYRRSWLLGDGQKVITVIRYAGRFAIPPLSSGLLILFESRASRI